MTTEDGAHGRDDDKVEVSRVEWEALQMRLALVERMLTERVTATGDVAGPSTLAASRVTDRRGLLAAG